jgi:hypothetical protein
MHIEVGDHAAVHELRLNKIAGEVDALSLCHLAGKGELDFTSKLRVLALLEGLDVIPQPLAVAPLLGRTFGQQNFAMLNAGTGAEIMIPIQALIVQLLARAIGGGRDGASAGSAADDLNGKMEDRHNDHPFTATKGTSE